MLTGWVCLYLFLVYVLTHGGKIQGWHSVIWIAATFVGMFAVIGIQGSVGGGRRTEDGGRRAEDGGRWAVGGGRWSVSSLWQQLRIALALSVAGLSLPILFSWILGHFTDFSWDGMTSRGITVRNLMLGEPALNEHSLGHVTAGFLADLTGSWQSGKGINLTLIWISFCFSFGGLRNLGFAGFSLWFLSSLAALNPVAVYQISCFQIDGHVASLFCCVIFAALHLLQTAGKGLAGWLPLILAVLGMATAKTSGFAYTFILLALLLTFLLGSPRVGSWQKSLTAVFVLGLVSLLGAVYLWSGLGVIQWGHLRLVSDIQTAGYGVGGGASKIEAYRNLSRPQTFFSSAFSMTESIPDEIRLKPPFAMTRRELRVFEELTPDPRAGGFGPQFSGAMLLAGLACTFLLFLRRPIYGPGLFVVLAAVVSSYFSQLWWARWTPQIWLILIGFLMTAVYGTWGGQERDGIREEKTQQTPAEKFGIGMLTGLAMLATAFNVFLVVLYYGIGMVRQENILNRQIELAKNLGEPVPIHIRANHDGSSFEASRLWFLDRGIPVAMLKQEPSRPRMKIHKTESRVPLPPDWKFSLKNPKDEVVFRKRALIEE